MSGKTVLNKTHAEKIASKLGAVLEEGREHTLAKLYEGGKYIAQFGIRRGKNSLGHDYIPKQIHFPMGKCLKLAECTVNRPDWIKALQERGLVPKPQNNG